MRLILKDYLLLLKEDKELDAVITNLTIDMDFIPLSNITRGRQYGVDLCARGKDENGEDVLFCFTIKRGNITRNNWSINPADVKPSIEDINDVFFINYIPDEYKQFKKKIILCYNGYLDQTLLQDMAKLKDKINSDHVKLEDWNIDEIIAKIESYQTLETLFDKDVMLNFRRALALIDLRENKNLHYYTFLNSLLINDIELTEKQIERRIRLVNLCLAITIKWCSNANNLKPAYFITERTMLQVYHWLNIKTKEYETGSKIINEAFAGLIQNWIEITKLSFDKLKLNYAIKYNLFNRSLTFEEYYFTTNEQIGILACIGNCYIELSKVFFERDIETSKLFYQIAIDISGSLIDLINCNPSSNYLLFDDDFIDIVSAHKLLIETNQSIHGNNWLNNMISVVIHWYYSNKIKPIFYYNIDKLLIRSDEHNSSCSFLVLAELCALYDNEQLYFDLRTFITKNFKGINLQVIFPEETIDEQIFNSHTEDFSSVLTDLALPEDFGIFKENIIQENVKMQFEKIPNAFKEGMTFLYFISFRHYRNYPFPLMWRNLLTENYMNNFEFIKKES